MRLQETSIFFQKKRYRHFYCCSYLPMCEGIDPVSRSLLKFKRGTQPDLDSWIDRALCGFRETPVPLSPDTIIIRALRHKETHPLADPPSSLDRLGHSLSREFNLPYLPDLLYKIRSTPLNQSLNRHQRITGLQNIYQVDPVALTHLAATQNLPAGASIQTPNPAPTSILLLDDILTTGATVLSILQTLHNHFPNCPVTIFTLAKTH